MLSTEEFVKQTNKKYGDGAMFKFDDKSSKDDIPCIDSGSIALNLAMGTNGYPLGRIIQIIGNPSSGKTTLALHAIANANKQGKNALFVDAEHALDRFYAREIGVDFGKLFVSQPSSGEEGIQIVDDAAKSGSFGIVVVDSVAALVPKRELDGDSGDAHIGLLARLMSQACRRMTAAVSKNNVVVLFINQWRANIATGGFGAPNKVASGGKALEYYSSLILDIARIKTITETGDEDPSSNRVQVTVKKNKLAPPYRECQFDIVFGKGISRAGEIVDFAEQFGILQKGGAWYKIENKPIAQGRANMIKLLETDDKLRNSIYDRITEAIRQNTM